MIFPCTVLSNAKTLVRKENVQLLLDRYPGAAHRTDEDGRLPLHVACAYGAPYDVIVLLIKYNPGGLSEHDNAGHPPFHVSCIRR